LVKTLEMDDGRVELRAVTGPEYGRIWDKDLVAAVMSIAGDGVGDTMWKVPGVLDWSTMTHNPFVDITKDTTTLYASDRDVFLFLVDDTHPIEAGHLPNGEPDLYFRDFYASNSEVGSKTLGIASFYLRAVRCNRNLWGTENRGDYHSPLEIRGKALRARGCPGFAELRELVAGALHRRYPCCPRNRCRTQ